jgi:starch synthase (maltosyl-transferring)
MNSALTKLEEELKKLRQKKFDNPYFVPSLWLDPENKSEEKRHEVKPEKFFLDKIKDIYKLSEKSRITFPERDWTKYAIIYNMFVRYATAYDHDNNGKVDIGFENGFRETGTFLKSIALLPYLHNLGINTIYLLPIAAIGIDGRKGNLGSPYAIRNPYKLDENLSEPFIDLSVEEQFAAFVEAAHMLGMKVVLEFVFRTASIDSDLALEHPEWFYWINEKIKDRQAGSKDEKKYGPPVFTEKELLTIKQKIENKDFTGLPIPHKEYLDMFTEVPKKVARVDNKIVGVLGEIKKTFCRIPGAFADWPPDDIQPVWDDVTYLRLYGHPAYNYIAYNTIRMYEQRLEQNQYRVRALWDNICNIIPYYQQNFDIDGVMIDMGHALPHELRRRLVETARKNNPEFVFWEENFVLSKKSVKDGYNAVVGYLPFDLHINQKVKQLIKNLDIYGSPLPFFGTAETHNTHRSALRDGGIEFSKFTWALVNFLPTIPFVLNGFELGEINPINTGLGFSEEENKNYPQETLALFSVSSLNWDNDNEISAFLKKILDLRGQIIDCKNNLDKVSIKNIDTSSKWIISFQRMNSKGDFLFIGNMNKEQELYFSIKVNEKFDLLYNLNDNRIINIANGWIICNLKPFEFIIGELKIDE